MFEITTYDRIVITNLDEEVDSNTMLKFYSKEEIDKYGVIGIGIKLFYKEGGGLCLSYILNLNLLEISQKQ